MNKIWQVIGIVLTVLLIVGFVRIQAAKVGYEQGLADGKAAKDNG